MISIGLKVANHDTGVGIVFNENDKTKIYNFHEERFNRLKNTIAFPYLSINEALKITKLKSIYDADVVVVEITSLNGIIEKKLLTAYGYNLDKFKNIIFVNHHYCHASNTFLFSNFDESLVIVQDAKGSKTNHKINIYEKFKNLSLLDFLNPKKKLKFAEGLSVYKANRNPFKLELIFTKKVSSTRTSGPKNVDILYSFARKFCSFGQFGAGKVMGLSSYGRYHPPKYFDLNLLDINDLDFEFSKFYKKNIKIISKKLIKFKTPKVFSSIEEITNSDEAKMASEAQHLLEQFMMKFSIKLKEKYKKFKYLCLSGGSALNLSANRKVYDLGIFKEVFIAPSSDDSGIALGAAIHGYYEILKQNTDRTDFFASYLGKDYNFDSNEISILGDNIKFSDDRLLEKCIEVLTDEKVIGICKGRSENGPRSLGNRSILALPNKVSQKNKVNLFKNREWWRPFSPVCIEEDLENYFDLKLKNPYMLFTTIALDITKKLCPAIVHFDGTARVQSINIKQNVFIYSLLKKLKDKGLPPILLNTSFNRAGEPIVESPLDAYNCFKVSPIDFLIIGNRFFSK